MSRSRRHAARRQLTMTHRRRPRWWAPWSSRCACGLDRWPCQYAGSVRVLRPARPRETVPDTAATPGWNGPTVAFTPLLTPAQRWRSNGGAQ